MRHRRHIPPSREQIERRYPHLISMLMWSCSLSVTEAVSCVQCYLGGMMFAGEAVNHAGGTVECLRHAARCRSGLSGTYSETYTSILRRWRYYLPEGAAQYMRTATVTRPQ